jgi:hypothetical protein
VRGTRTGAGTTSVTSASATLRRSVPLRRPSRQGQCRADPVPLRALLAPLRGRAARRGASTRRGASRRSLRGAPRSFVVPGRLGSLGCGQLSDPSRRVSRRAHQPRPQPRPRWPPSSSSPHWLRPSPQGVRPALRGESPVVQHSLCVPRACRGAQSHRSAQSRRSARSRRTRRDGAPPQPRWPRGGADALSRETAAVRARPECAAGV